MKRALFLFTLAACGKQFNYEYCKGHPGEYPQYCGLDGGIDAPADALPDAPPGFHYVGGAVSGLVSGTSVTLQLNGANDLVEAANASYLFPKSLMEGTTYTVTVKTQPIGAMCNVANGTGTVPTMDVTNVDVTCMPFDPGVRCGVTYCMTGGATPVCCTGTSTCAASATGCTGLAMSCDDTADCMGTQICCGVLNGGSQPQRAVCDTPSNCTSNNNSQFLCNPGAMGGDTACTATQMCLASNKFIGYDNCQ